MDKENLPIYKYSGARSLVLLHDKHLKSFYETWKQASAKNIVLPKTEDPDYESLTTLLSHVLKSAGNYMNWICEKLELPEPNINPTPKPDLLVKGADVYINHILEKWLLPLSEVEEIKFHTPTYTSSWGVEYCIDAMLEHAVMHPIRHEYQLKSLILAQLEK
jgi:hypothetical protein